MAEIYKTSGDIIPTSPENGQDFSLKELKAVVEGYIEIVHLKDGRLMVVNEEGKLLGLPVNHNASNLVDWRDVIVGNVLVCDSKEIK